jgi:hypothetical protein
MEKNMESRTISKKNIDKILKFIELNEKKKDENNKGRLDEDRNGRSERGNG